MLKITLGLNGVAPMIPRNGRLANPLDPLTRQVSQLAKKRDKTEEDYRALLPLEAYAGSYETPEGFLGVPDENVYASMIESAKAFKMGKRLTSALLLVEAGRVAPIYIGDKVFDAREYCYSDPLEHLFIRTVVIGGRRTLRGRAIIRGWSTTHEFLLLDDIVDPKDLKKIFDRAGRLVGLCDWRPNYGTFTTRVIDTQVIEEEVAA